MDGYQGEDRRNDNTRDIAVGADVKINQHMTDCTQFRLSIQNILTEFRQDLKAINWRLALIVGAITLAGKGIDWVAKLGH